MNSRANEGKQIEKDIYQKIKDSDRPVSTREISITINRSWHTIDKHCMKLQLEDKIKCIRLGNNTLWVLNNEK